jgi:hypothetical protein
VIEEVDLELWKSPICGRKVVSCGSRSTRSEADPLARKAISHPKGDRCNSKDNAINRHEAYSHRAEAALICLPAYYFGAITTASVPGPTWAPIVVGVGRMSGEVAVGS